MQLVKRHKHRGEKHHESDVEKAEISVETKKNEKGGDKQPVVESHSSGGGIIEFMTGGACCACGGTELEVRDDAEPDSIVAATTKSKPKTEEQSDEDGQSPSKRKWLKKRQRKTDGEAKKTELKNTSTFF